MKIGLLTLSASDNCGSLLQCYALQHLLEERGNDVEVIDLITVESRKLYQPLHLRYIKHPRRFVGQFFRYADIKKQKLDYQLFRENYLNLTKRTYSNSNELSELDGYYDMVVCGSDQVWNVYMRDFNPAFLLPWCERTKHIAYAVSLGDQKKGRLKDLVNAGLDIDSYLAVSVREESSKMKFFQELGVEVDKCLDPTLCISVSEWDKMTPKGCFPNEPYIFYYSYSYWNDEKNRIVKRFSEIVGLPVYVINPSRWVDGNEKKYGFRLFKQTGPIAFLLLMKGCRFSLVESFHGAVFSFLFEKQFFFLEDKMELDDRINDLLELLDLKNRVLKDENIDMQNFPDIEYPYTSNELSRQYKESISFLDKKCCLT